MTPSLAKLRAFKALMVGQHNAVARLAAAVLPLAQHAQKHNDRDFSIPVYNSLSRLQGAFAPIDSPPGTTLAHAVGMVEGVLMAANAAYSSDLSAKFAMMDALTLTKDIMFSQDPRYVDDIADDLAGLERAFARLASKVSA